VQKWQLSPGGGPGVGRAMALGLSCAGFRVAIRVDQGKPERTGFRGLGQADGPFGRGAIRSGYCSVLETSAAGGGHSNVTGRYPSRKMEATIQFESHRVELPTMYELEHNDEVLECWD